MGAPPNLYLVSGEDRLCGSRWPIRRSLTSKDQSLHGLEILPGRHSQSVRDAAAVFRVGPAVLQSGQCRGSADKDLGCSKSVGWMDGWMDGSYALAPLNTHVPLCKQSSKSSV